jgi:hypothetical protein
MGIEIGSGYCKDCGENRKLERKGTSHILHLLLVVIFFFVFFPLAIIWIFIWLLSSIKFGGWICSTCGSKRVNAKKSYSFIASLMILLIILIVVKTNQNMQGTETTQKLKQTAVKKNIGTIKLTCNTPEETFKLDYNKKEQLLYANTVLKYNTQRSDKSSEYYRIEYAKGDVLAIIIYDNWEIEYLVFENHKVKESYTGKCIPEAIKEVYVK